MNPAGRGVIPVHIFKPVYFQLPVVISERLKINSKIFGL